MCGSCWDEDRFDFEEDQVVKEGSGFALAGRLMGEEHCTGD